MKTTLVFLLIAAFNSAALAQSWGGNDPRDRMRGMMNSFGNSNNNYPGQFGTSGQFGANTNQGGMNSGFNPNGFGGQARPPPPPPTNSAFGNGLNNFGSSNPNGGFGGNFNQPGGNQWGSNGGQWGSNGGQWGGNGGQWGQQGGQQPPPPPPPAQPSQGLFGGLGTGTGSNPFGLGTGVGSNLFGLGTGAGSNPFGLGTGTGSSLFGLGTGLGSNPLGTMNSLSGLSGLLNGMQGKKK
uniref:Uncharacterized protein n=1 Tax=Plectus sambesii TaxID=2011161 RepID=A0A914X4Z6_9BILA